MAQEQRTRADRTRLHARKLLFASSFPPGSTARALWDPAAAAGDVLLAVDQCADLDVPSPRSIVAQPPPCLWWSDASGASVCSLRPKVNTASCTACGRPYARDHRAAPLSFTTTVRLVRKVRAVPRAKKPAPAGVVKKGFVASVCSTKFDGDRYLVPVRADIKSVRFTSEHPDTAYFEPDA
ncbi:hypothetical protein DIPPA_05644 [Diplonema papillatum]|nr:hypothetical protein DIPPA_05644 [Diplonema papillatum]